MRVVAMSTKENPPEVALKTGQKKQNSSENNTAFRCGRQWLPAPLDAFRQAMAKADIETPDTIIPDGKLHRFHVSGDKTGTRNGWYVLHIDKPASGIFGSHKTTIKHLWHSMSRDQMSWIDRKTIRQRIESAKLERQQEMERRHRTTQQNAMRIWRYAEPVQGREHPYLERKCVQAHGLRIAKRWGKKIQDSAGAWQEHVVENVLLVPMIDWENNLHNVQAIFSAKDKVLGRDKDFLAGGRKEGLFHCLGAIDHTSTLILAEGFSTGATIHEATGYPVLVCFDCGNLKPVAIEARRRFPTIDLIIAADDDRHTPGNPGLTKARAAALASRARLAIPSFDQEVAE